MKSYCLLFLFLFFFNPVSYSQNQYIIASYNILNYPGTTSAGRNPYFRTVMENIEPDILVVQEILSQAGVNEFLTNVLFFVSDDYSAGAFINGPDTDNAIFFKKTAFTFLANNVITTSLRDINEFVLKENPTGDTLRIYSVHLKAGTASSDQLQRLAEVIALRNVTINLPLNSNFMVLGDFNIYGSNEPAYQNLLNQSSQGYVFDIYNLSGTWNNPNYALYHTQSPRTRQFNGGATGGMDDRFDMILFSPAVMDSGGVYYIPGSFINYGNDGEHYNDSINRPPNNAVGQTIANALHYSSDHLPVYASFRFEQSNIQLTVDLSDGWNIISVPLLAADMTAITLFPTATSQFYSYTGVYSQVNELENGKGYWAKFDGNQSTTITGTYVNSNETAVNQGWNVIGPFAFDVQTINITTIPPNIIISPFYGFEGAYYTANTLLPGKGYWVKTSEDGIMQLNSE